MSHGFHADPETGVCYRTLDFLGCPGYRVGDDGSVWTRKKTGGHGLYDTWRAIRADPGHAGHKRVLLMPGRNRVSVHHLVLLAFVGPRPPGMQCRHFPDRDPANNNVWNLRWGTHTENMRDKRLHRTSRVQRGASNVMAKLSDQQVIDIRREHADGKPQHRIAEERRLSKSTVSLIVNRKLWPHV